MAFISNSSYPKVGDEVEITKDVKMTNGTFTKGHKFKVIAEGERGLDLEDSEGRKLLETGLIYNIIKKI